MLKKLAFILILILSDLIIFYFSFILSYETRILLNKFTLPYLIKFEIPLSKLLSFLWIPLIYIFSFAYEGLYTRRFDFWDELKQIIKAIFLANLIIFAIISIGKLSEEISRSFIFILGIYTLVFYSFAKPYVKKYLLNKNIGVVKSIVIDTKDNFLNIKNLLDKEEYAGFEIIKYIDIDEFIQKKINIDYIDVIIINESCLEKSKFISVYSKLINHVNLVYIIPDIKEIPVLNSELEYFNMGDLLFFRIKNNLNSKFNQILKRSFDITLSILMFPLFIVILILVAIIIKLDSPGPIFFRQNRIGKNGKVIKIYKFRTMYVDAEKRLKNLLENNPSLKKEWEKTRKLRNDPRITKVGKFLRKTSLDELPQIINVIKGDMSFVGPRPVLQEELDKYYKDFSKFYFIVKPGITGLWQVSGRNHIDYEKRVRLDVFYITNWSFWLDIIILIKTFKAVLKKEGAY